MKKVLVCVLAVVLVLSLAGCGAPAASSVSSISSETEISSASEASSVVESSSSEASESSVAEISSFEFSTDDFIAVMDTRLKGGGYKTIADSPVEITDQEIEGVGAAISKNYEIAKGLNLLLKERKEDKKLIQIMCVIDELGVEDAELWGYFGTTLLFKVDMDGYKAVAEQLNLSDTTDGKHVTATGETATFTHMVLGGTEMLIAYPKL